MKIFFFFMIIFFSQFKVNQGAVTKEKIKTISFVHVEIK